MTRSDLFLTLLAAALAIPPAAFAQSDYCTGDGGPEGRATDKIAYYCECGDRTCFKRIRLTAAEYEHLRAIPEGAAVVPGHEPSDIDEVVERYRDRLIVTRQTG